MGRVIVAGAGRMTIPITGTLASDLAVGTIVKLMEGGTTVEYLVVNQGIPSNSDLYDASCNGTWLLRRYTHTKQYWNNSAINTYNDSFITTWLNDTFFNRFDTVAQKVIKSVKIPYCIGNASAVIKKQGEGLATKIFLLSGYEVKFIGSGFGGNEYTPSDGAVLSYFDVSVDDITKQRLAFDDINKKVTNWWTRSAQTNVDNQAFSIGTTGGTSYGIVNTSQHDIRPALIIPFTAKFDKDTLILKG